METTKTYEELIAEMEELRLQLQEANDTIEAIRTGQVDALVVSNESGHQLYTLKSADHTYRLFIERMKEGAVTLNKDEIILYSNSQFASMVDLPLSKVIGVPFSQFVPDEFKDQFRKLIKKSWQSDSKGEISLKNKNNEWVPFLLSFTSLELDEGRSLSIILTDLSIQKETEKQLKFNNEQLEEARLEVATMNEELEHTVRSRTKDLYLSREYFKFLADNIPVIIWTADKAGKLDYVNRRWVEYTGFDLEESKTKQSELIHPDDLEVSTVAWRRAVQLQQKYEQEFRFKRDSDGLFRWFYAEAIPFKDEHGHTTAWIGTSIDIDAQKKELEKKDEFISVASHELRTPLTSLKGYVQLMESEQNLPDDIKLYVSKVSASIDKLQHLIDALLDASKIRAGKLKFTKSTFNLTNLVNQCIDNSSYMYPAYDIKRELQGDIMVIGNEERLEQVIMNLINNAVKYSPDSKKIIVRAEMDESSGVVSVSDFGIGMSLADQNKIFDRFYRVDGHEFYVPGLGMGLYIASEIIKEHDGTIGVQSKLNEGSVFCFTLPLAKSH
jgi:two-component system CheB/CheR fusion protein